MAVEPAMIRAWAAAGGDKYPGAVWKPLPENATQPVIVPRAFILHTQAGSKPAANAQVWSYMSSASVVNEPTFLLQMDGLLWQCMGLFTRADSNYKANGWTLSVETQDMGSATLDQTPWTEAQLQVLAELCAYLNLHPNIRLPLQLVPTWDGAGVAPHNRFSQWSASAHSCPGRARTAQVPEVIGRAADIVAWTPPKPEVIPTPEEGDVSIRILRDMDPEPAFYAQFIAVCDKDGHSIEVQWSGSGDDPKVAKRMADLRAAGVTDQHITLAGLKNNALHAKNRPEDIIDMKRRWTAADFAP